eukprot:CAMPEP_0197651382 /NCGR_PEP_ID=MMETSP1338-20131121/32270_1 /TAXON_ID=43686 ORGANISM="Pelagodinium beii, Strain RCC1491" /NCGR_SAMPLE_ID=MMETSP1338 /ASSEMBLY_ACC=CAM_ASM_000754 /LENGTH=39 /DNA_ID= /DNA_START= /DNA_END= /DNA_ORIENTATION=
MTMQLHELCDVELRILQDFHLADKAILEWEDASVAIFVH